MMRFLLLAPFLMLLASCDNAHCQVCETCPSVVAADVVPASSTGPSARAAVRVRTGGGCGSGSVVGHFNGNSLIMTNAHVAGTRVGREVTIDYVVNGQGQSRTARVIMAAYSDRTLTDWALLQADGWVEIQPVPMSTTRPSGSHYTKGSPRCVWPMTETDIRTADVSDSSPLWRWRPNAIGGQSGSGVWSDSDNKQYGLLTWSWGGLGAGQMTAEIYRQAKNQTVSGEPRIADLLEVGQPAKVTCENGFFMEAGLTDLPIWDKTTPDDPAPDTGTVTEKEAALLASLKARSEAVGVDYEKTLSLMIGGTSDETADNRIVGRLRQRARERNIDFVKLIELILQILELFR